MSKAMIALVACACAALRTPVSPAHSLNTTFEMIELILLLWSVQKQPYELGIPHPDAWPRTMVLNGCCAHAVSWLYSGTWFIQYSEESAEAILVVKINQIIESDRVPALRPAISSRLLVFNEEEDVRAGICQTGPGLTAPFSWSRGQAMPAASCVSCQH